MKKNKNVIVVLILLICSMFYCSIPKNNIVYADDSDSKYTNVLDDLKTDTNFNEYSYPQILNDYSLQVIQIAESNQNELFIYVYQPSSTIKNLIATSANIAITFGQNLNFINYRLTFLNSIGVFYKYKVNDFIVSSATIREYEITSIYREFDETIDEALSDDNENTIDEVNFKVAKHWTFTVDGITCNDIETITITDKYVGLVRYEDGYTGIPGLGFSYVYPGCDSHFIAFSTDRQIDKLMEADVFYTTQSYDYFKMTSLGITIDESEIFGDITENYSYSTYVDRVQVSIPNGWYYGYTYNWDRIQTVAEFVATENREYIYNFAFFNVGENLKITNEGLTDLQDKQWVLRFAETDFLDYYSLPTGQGTTQTHNIEKTIVGDVSILRLKFETDGNIYNLGVIDNKQTGDGLPDNILTFSFQITDWFGSLLGILLLILLIVILAPFLPQIFSFLWWLIKGIFNFIVYIISIPFGWFEKKKPDKKGAKKNEKK